MIRMFLNGQGMRGGSLSDAMSGARFVAAVPTVRAYRFYSVRDEFPGLYPVSTLPMAPGARDVPGREVPGRDLPGREVPGREVPGEVYEMSYTDLRERLLPVEPPELELTVVALADGTEALSMQLRRELLGAPGVTDISDAGGWFAYRAARPR